MSRKKRYEGVMFNIIYKRYEGVESVNFSEKKRYVTLEWALTSFIMKNYTA